MQEEGQLTLDDFSWVAALFNIHEDMTLGFWLLYAAVVVLSIMVFNLGFARKLPLLKNVVVYAALLLGCFVLTFFAIFMPVVESLLAVAVVLSIYRVRLKLHKRNEAKKA